MHKDALIGEIGRALLADPKIADGAWDRYALIVVYGDRSRRISGFRYAADGGYDAATPEHARLGGLLDALREATRVEGEAPWQACVIRIERASGKIALEFEYDDPGRWEIRPDNLDEIAERAKRAAAG